MDQIFFSLLLSLVCCIQAWAFIILFIFPQLRIKHLTTAFSHYLLRLFKFNLFFLFFLQIFISYFYSAQTSFHLLASYSYSLALRQKLLIIQIIAFKNSMISMISGLQVQLIFKALKYLQCVHPFQMFLHEHHMGLQFSFFSDKATNIFFSYFQKLQLYLVMLRIITVQKILTPQNFLIFKSPIAKFCNNKDYFTQKKLKQQQKSKNRFLCDQSKLKSVKLSLKDLAPNFFQKALPMRQCDKIIMPDKRQNAIENSYIQLDIPVQSDKQIGDSLIRFNSNNEVRIGRILQYMDSIAGIIGYRHCFGNLSGNNPFVLVTACVDSINLFEPITILHDIKMEGYVNYVGRSSMEIQINIFQSNILKSNALFTMASRNAINHQKSHVCPKLKISHLTEPQFSKAKIREKEAEQNIQRRKKQMLQSYKNNSPNAQDIKIIHSMFLNSHLRPLQGINIDSTLIKNTFLMHIQQRNVHHKIFGGFLMRQMIETGWITASEFAGNENMKIQDITNIYFRAPVQIGYHLRVRGRVSYTHGNIIVVTVQAKTYSFYPSPIEKICCYSHIFIKCHQQQKKVFPQSYQDGIHYLEALNAYKSIFTNI